MKYIRPNPNPSGAYPPPQSTPAPGLVPISDELVAKVVAYNGFITLTVEDVAEGDPNDLVVIRKVTAVTPNTEAWEAWKASLPPEDDTAAEPEEATAVWDELDAAYQEGVNSV